MSASEPRVDGGGTPPPDKGDATTEPATSLTLDQQVGYYVDMWKQSVDVQMHFNDIEWRIRGLALTVATFAIGAAGVAAKDGTRVGWFSLGALVIMIGLLLWYAFYFVDRVWYHPLLKASVAHGTEIENEIKKALPRAGMTAAITAGSEYETAGFVRLISRRKEMHSDDKLTWFYSIGGLALALAAIALQIGVLTGSHSDIDPMPAKPTPSATASGS
ncbi:hypothetical protein [Phycicoccus duodecadis]|uniref:Uncharacterized protein n=1 Tax=Phycicoccus duodecadis TaxID=173053 RepID=A0A2N3YIK9_9MICO|nr:hypothetical protein [Phycicoccus duodecadis]PKW26686.1 hypothetical protein ATL31_1503 [Phycicoccus duodecadis]